MSGFGSSILIDAAPPCLPACLMRNAGWLYSGFVAATSRAADADSSAPSFVVIEIVAIVFPLYVGVLRHLLMFYRVMNSTRYAQGKGAVAICVVPFPPLFTKKVWISSRKAVLSKPESRSFADRRGAGDLCYG